MSAEPDPLVAPFPWFGGKRRVAAIVREMLGDVRGYIEPFFGSGAVLLSGPRMGVETINDADGMVANFWRAVQANPEAVAAHADWPVNEADLHARHLWLVRQRDDLTSRLMADPDWYDAKAAGWWCWGASAWIGSGWCSGKGPWTEIDGAFVNLGSAGMGVNRQLPHLGSAGMGVNRQLPHLGSAGMGVNRQLPHLGSAGRGVNRQLPHLGSAGRGVLIRGYMLALSERLRDVRVACGDWSRVTGQSVLRSGGMPVGVFLDPPYRSDTAIDYADGASVDHAALETWCRANGADPQIRIVLCGYDGEYDLPGWQVVPWKAQGGYGSQGAGRGRDNARLERLWASPGCTARRASAAPCTLDLGAS